MQTFVIGRIHGAIVAATVGAIVAATNTCLIKQPTGDRRGDNRLQCIRGAIVAAIVAATISPTGCGDDRPVYTRY